MSKNTENDGKKHKFKDRIFDFFASEIASALFFLIVGIGLVAFPTQTMFFFAKIVFGVLLIFAGLYNTVMFLLGKKRLTVFHLYSGVVMLVLGLYMFINPEVIYEVLPQLLGGLVIVDSVWMMQASFRYYKVEDPGWKIFLPAGLVCFGLGIIIAVNPFAEVHSTVFFGGIVFIINGIADIFFSVIMLKDVREEKAAVEAAASAASAAYLAEKNNEKEPKEHKFKNPFKSKTEKETHFGDAPDTGAAQTPEGAEPSASPFNADYTQDPESQASPAGNDEAQGGGQE